MGHVGQTDAAVESLVGVVVADTDLELHRLHELSLLAFLEHVVDVLLQEVGVNLGH